LLGAGENTPFEIPEILKPLAALALCHGLGDAPFVIEKAEWRPLIESPFLKFVPTERPLLFPTMSIGIMVDLDGLELLW